MTRHQPGGRYTASVSIRSGRGSMTHDRVMRFDPDFESREQAANFATSQALAWIDEILPATGPKSGSADLPPTTFGLHVRRLLTRTGNSWGILFNASSKD